MKKTLQHRRSASNQIHLSSSNDFTGGRIDRSNSSQCSVFKFQLIYQSTKVYALVEQARVDYCILCTEYLRKMFGSKAPVAVRVWLVACSCCKVVDSL